MPTPYNSNSQREEIEKVKATNIRISTQLQEEGFETIDLNEPTSKNNSLQNIEILETTQDKKKNILDAIRKNDDTKITEYSQNPDYRQVFQESKREFLNAAQVSDQKIKQDSNLSAAEKDQKRATNLSIVNNIQEFQPVEELTTWAKIKLFFRNIVDSVFPNRKTPENTPLLQNNTQRNYGTFATPTLSAPSKEQDLDIQKSAAQKVNRDSFHNIRETLTRQTQDIQGAGSGIGTSSNTPSNNKTRQEPTR